MVRAGHRDGYLHERQIAARRVRAQEPPLPALGPFGIFCGSPVILRNTPPRPLDPNIAYTSRCSPGERMA